MEIDIDLKVSVAYTLSSGFTNSDGYSGSKEVDSLEVFVTDNKKQKFEISHLLTGDQLQEIEQQILDNL